jgi:hypothetical protein
MERKEDNVLLNSAPVPLGAAYGGRKDRRIPDHDEETRDLA